MFEHQKPTIRNREWLQRRPVVVEASAKAPLPRVFEAGSPKHEVGAWLRERQADVRQALDVSGAVLLRGFQTRTVQKLEAIVREFAGEPLEYLERSSPRVALHGRVYSSTEYPSDQEIALHNENSYAAVFPALLFFQCMVRAERGGQTPLADCRKVLSRLPVPLVQRFVAHGVRYVRTFNEGIGLPWQAVFGTDCQHEVERKAAQFGYDVRWPVQNALQTVRHGPAVLTTSSGERAWFNHAAFFHLSSLPPLVAQGLLDELGEQRLPAQTYFGDGSRIELETIELVRNAYRNETCTFEWLEGDLLIVNNLLVAHGRQAFCGLRKIAVAMARACEAVPSLEGHSVRRMS